MNKLRFSFILLLFSSMCVLGQSQERKFQVDFNEIKGELSSNDLFQKDFGRYDGYEIELLEGEAVNFLVYSNSFQPSLALVNSNREVFKQSDGNDKSYANIVSSIPTSGSYVLYVIGDDKSRGRYILQTAIAESNALSLKNSVDFCTTLDFLLSHATAYFFLLEKTDISKDSSIRLIGSVDSYIDEELGSYKATFYNANSLTEAERIFKNITDQVNDCLGKGWDISSSTWYTNGNNKKKSKTFTENTNNRSRYVKISLIDYIDSSLENKNNFCVEIEINRRH